MKQAAPPAPGLFRVAFRPGGRITEVPSESTVLEAAQRAGVPLPADCGGRGTCGRCAVRLSPPSPGTPPAHGPEGPLACQTRVDRDLVVETREPPVPFVPTRPPPCPGPVKDPPVIAVPCHSTTPSRNGDRCDFERFRTALAKAGLGAIDADLPTRQALARHLLDEGGNLAVQLRGREAIGFNRADRPALGLAVDVGTTRIEGALYRLDTGASLAGAQTANPHVAYGPDVIQRLDTAARDGERAQEMAQNLRHCLDDLVGSLADRTGSARHEIADACLVGNPAAVHLLLGLPTRSLTVAPFTASQDGPFERKARDIGLRLAPGAYVFIPPSVGGFVGADHLAFLLASGIAHPGPGAVAIDVGTNTEITVRAPVPAPWPTGSCASGPAFEGGHLACGMVAGPGAIVSVDVEGDALRVATADGGPPVGLAGTGVLDAVAALARLGAMDRNGHLVPGAPGNQQTQQGLRATLVPPDPAGHRRAITLTQRELGEIQLAKAAIRAGLDTLLQEAGISATDIEQVVLAGAFGTNLRVPMAEAVGLVPHLPRARVVAVGNGALAGAAKALLSRSARSRLLELRTTLKAVPLATQPGFSKKLCRALPFPGAVH